MKKPQFRNETGVIGLSTDNSFAGVDRAGNISAGYASSSVDIAADVTTVDTSTGIHLVESITVNDHGTAGFQNAANVAFDFDLITGVYLKRIATAFKFPRY